MDRETALDHDSIADVVAVVAGGRAKRRRLAQALADRPALLTDGRSPAPRALGDLLIGLRNAGAVSVAAPVCAECGKPLRSLQRRGQDWYCGGCGPRPEPCTGCGSLRPVSVRDRHGHPHCVCCPPADRDGDPTEAVVEIVTALDNGLAAETVAAAVQAAAPRAGQRRRLAWALADRPTLLTGDGAHAPVPAVLRLIDALVDARSTRVVRPACPHCGRVIALVKPRGGLRLCRNCVAKSRAETCSRCGAVREAATRDEQGQPLCPNCLITDPANREACLGCGRRRQVSLRTAEGPLCPTCTPVKTMICSICARSAPATISKLTGQPCCRTCRQRRARCTRCGNVRLIRGGSVSNPLCVTCTRPDAALHICPGCGAHSQLRIRRCARCALRQRLHELLRDDTGNVHPQLQALHDNLANHDRPNTVLLWLNKDAATAILRELQPENER